MSHSPIPVVRVLTRLNIGGPAVHAAILSTKLPPGRFSTCLVVGTPDTAEGDLAGSLRDRVRLIHLRGLRRSLHPWADAVTLWRLARIMWREQPRIIHTHMAKAGTLGRLAGLLYNRLGPGRAPHRRALLVHTFHGHVLDGYFSAAATRFFLGIERWLARRTDCLIAVSEEIARQLQALGIGRRAQWRVVRLGLELEPLARLSLPNGIVSLRAGLVGRLVPIKQPGLFLEGVQRAIQRRVPVSGIVVGDGELRQELERQAAALGLTGQLRFTGWQHDLPALYGQLDAVCLTSRNEGTPVALIEAMAAGRVVIATDVGGVPDVIGRGSPAHEPVAPGTFRVTERGIMIRPEDAEGLAAALAAVASDAGLRRRLGEAARAHVMERYAEERLVNDIGSLYDALLRSRA